MLLKIRMSHSTASSGPGALDWILLSGKCRYRYQSGSDHFQSWIGRTLASVCAIAWFFPSAFSANHIASADDKRLKKAEQKAWCMSQRWRKSLRSNEVATEQGHITQEGITYNISLVHFDVSPPPPPFFLSIFGAGFFLPAFFKATLFIYFCLFIFIWSTNYIFLTGFFQSQAYYYFLNPP